MNSIFSKTDTFKLHRVLQQRTSYRVRTGTFYKLRN